MWIVQQLKRTVLARRWWSSWCLEIHTGKSECLGVHKTRQYELLIGFVLFFKWRHAAPVYCQFRLKAVTAYGSAGISRSAESCSIFKTIPQHTRLTIKPISHLILSACAKLSRVGFVNYWSVKQHSISMHRNFRPLISYQNRTHCFFLQL